MKNVAPNARSFESERPLTVAAIACSRMPKWRFLPLGVAHSRSPASSNFNVVLFEVPRSAEPPRNQGMFCASTFNTWPDASRPAMPLGSAGKFGRLRSQPAGSSRRCICIDLGGEIGKLFPVFGKKLLPSAARLGAAFADPGGEMLAHAVGHEKFGVLRPAIGALGEFDFFFSKRLAMGGRGIVPVRRAVADMAVDDDQGRPMFGLAKDRERILDPTDVIGIAHTQHIPPIPHEAGGDVLGEGDAGSCPRW